MLLIFVEISTVYATTVSIVGLQFTLPLGLKTIDALSRRMVIDQEQSTFSQPSGRIWLFLDCESSKFLLCKYLTLTTKTIKKYGLSPLDEKKCNPISLAKMAYLVKKVQSVYFHLCLFIYSSLCKVCIVMSRFDRLCVCMELAYSNLSRFGGHVFLHSDMSRFDLP